jgi:TetR/AcrR family transcriptional regulator, regulator of autoinduction and epiphytic fitness
VGETSVTAASDAPSSQDGRLTRAARTRAAVVDALLTLNERGNPRPTARDIAAEAGVSLRSLYVHFDDLEALFVAASIRHAERITAVLPPLVVDGSFEERLDSFLARRVTLFEVGAGVRRAALLQEPFSPALQHALSEGRKAGRAEVRRTFAPEISGAADPELSSRLWRALEVVTSAATWEALRIHQDLSVAAATEQVRDMVLAYIAAWGPSDGAAGQAPTHSRSSSTPARA